jgi:copper transport protein
MGVRLRFALLMLCCLAVVSVTGGQARAHAALIAAAPADGAALATAPAQMTLRFSEPVSPLVLKLIGPDGAARSLDRYALQDRTLVVETPGGLAGGTHVLSWRVVSGDGHPVGGSVLFSIGAPSASAPIAAGQGDPVVRGALWFGKLCLYLGLFLGVGGAAFALWIAPLSRSARRFAAAMMIVGATALPLALAAQRLDALGASAGDLLQPAIWRAAAGGSFGVTALLAALALLLGLASLRLRAAAARGVVALAVLGAGIALAASGHASAAAPQALMRPAVFLHAVSIAAWAGALLPLLSALGRADGARALDSFSRRIPAIVAVILVSGLALAIVQVETPDALVTTDYGRVLLIKLGFVAGLFGLAGWNRFRLSARVQTGDGAAATSLRRIIAVELLLMALVFGTAAFWRLTPPPRALAIAASRPASVHIHSDKAMAEISLTPGRAGPVAVEIALLDGEFGPLAAKEVRIALSNPAAGIEALERQAVRAGDGTWRVSGLILPRAGRWTIELEILVSDFEMLRLREAVEIRP